MEPRVYYRRNLPHWHPAQATFFLTMRLKGPLPPHLRRERPQDMSEGRYFVLNDLLYDRHRTKQDWLARPAVAQIVADALQFRVEQGWYTLHAWVIMPNHLHGVLTPVRPLAEVTKVLKGYTARSANQMLGRAGKPFWQPETFDRWVRSEGEFERLVRYTEENPVKAGLCLAPELWRWSSAYGIRV